jgi:putative IMPACT (imprinted ancient) family translation regulator
VKEWEFVVVESWTRVFRANGTTAEEAVNAFLRDPEKNGREVEDTLEYGEVLGIRRIMGEAEYDPLDEEYGDGRTI